MKRQAMYVSRSIQDRSLNYFFRGIPVNVKYSVCVCVCVCVCVALFIQHAKRMRSIMLSSVACLTLAIF